MVRVRFAPSPTGQLHIGGARTALFNYLIARSAGGKYLLRIDDTDVERSRPEYERDIVESLSWLGLSWDEGPDIGGPFGPYRQSERRDRHLAHAELLLKKSAAYRDADGSIRLRYPDHEVVVDDTVCGRCVFSPPSLGPEPVLVRADGSPTYHLASVCDDIDMEITHVVRGQDHLTNTAKHQIICEGLGGALPRFAHLPLILGEDGSKLSKRNSQGLVTVADFRREGYIHQAIINFLASLGWSHPEAKEHLTLQDAIEAFDVSRISLTAAICEIARLKHLNGWWLRHLSADDLMHDFARFAGEYAGELEARGGEYLRALTAVLKDQIGLLSELPRYYRFVFEQQLDLSPAARSVLADPAFRSGASAALERWLELLSCKNPQAAYGCYTRGEVDLLVAEVKGAGLAPAKTVFQTLRLATIGEVSGPELSLIVPFISCPLLADRAERLREALAAYK